MIVKLDKNLTAISIILMLITYGLLHLYMQTMPSVSVKHIKPLVEVHNNADYIKLEPKGMFTVGDKIYPRSDAQKEIDAKILALGKQSKQIAEEIKAKEQARLASLIPVAADVPKVSIRKIRTNEAVSFTESIVKEVIADEINGFIDKINILTKIGNFILEKQ